MKDLSGARAFVTGAANGIGLGICQALARAGVMVAMGDIEAASLARAVDEVGHGARGFVVDVSDAGAVNAVTDEVGEIEILVNNAGVSAGSTPVAEVPPNQWDWLFGVNVHGVLNGVRAFLPGMLERGKPGHIVNTASIGGLQVNSVLRHGSYSTTKYAVVALTEALRLDLAESPIGVSVFCPALVMTTLDRSGERRPARFGGAYESSDVASVQGGISLLPAISAIEAGERVVHGIRENELFLLTHPQVRPWIEARHERIMAGFESLARFKAGGIA
jgi:NADP-dependent 3-hydroxy acid dehydrogenase YdfG